MRRLDRLTHCRVPGTLAELTGLRSVKWERGRDRVGSRDLRRRSIDDRRNALGRPACCRARCRFACIASVGRRLCLRIGRFFRWRSTRWHGLLSRREGTLAHRRVGMTDNRGRQRRSDVEQRMGAWPKRYYPKRKLAPRSWQSMGPSWARHDLPLAGPVVFTDSSRSLSCRLPHLEADMLHLALVQALTPVLARGCKRKKRTISADASGPRASVYEPSALPPDHACAASRNSHCSATTRSAAST